VGANAEERDLSASSPDPQPARFRTPTRIPVESPSSGVPTPRPLSRTPTPTPLPRIPRRGPLTIPAYASPRSEAEADSQLQGARDALPEARAGGQTECPAPFSSAPSWVVASRMSEAFVILL